MAAAGAMQAYHRGKALAVIVWQEAIDADGFVAAFETNLGLDYGEHKVSNQHSAVSIWHLALGPYIFVAVSASFTVIVSSANRRSDSSKGGRAMPR